MSHDWFLRATWRFWNETTWRGRHRETGQRWRTRKSGKRLTRTLSMTIQREVEERHRQIVKAWATSCDCLWDQVPLRGPDPLCVECNGTGKLLVPKTFATK